MTQDSSQATGQSPNQPAPDSVTQAAAVVTPVTPAPASVSPGATASATVPIPPVTPAAPTAPESAVKPDVTPVTPVAPVVPQDYALTLPSTDQFKDFKFDQAFLPAMAPSFKEAGLTQEQLNKILPTYLTFQAGAVQRMLATDLEAVMKDPVIGGLKWGETQSLVNDAILAFADPGERKELERMGIANRPSLVRMFARIGRAMRGDSPAAGQPNAAEGESRADRIYGRTNKA